MEMPEGFKRGKKTEQLTEVLEPIGPGNAFGEAGKPPPGKPAGARILRGAVSLLLWVAVLASLAINVYLLTLLRQTREERRTLTEAMGSAAEELKSAQEESFAYTVNITESVPVNVSITGSQIVDVPISTTVPYTGVVNVPCPIAIRLLCPPTVPVSVTVPVRITVQQTVTTTVPFSSVQQTEIHREIEIPVADTPLAGRLERIEAWLRQTAGESP